MMMNKLFLILGVMVLVGCNQNLGNKSSDTTNNQTNNNQNNSAPKQENYENFNMSMLAPSMTSLSMSDEYNDTFSDAIVMSYFRLENAKNFDNFLESFSIGSELQIFIDPNHFKQYKLNMKDNTNYHFMLHSKKGCILAFESIIDKNKKHIQPTSEIISGGDANNCMNAQQEFIKFNEFFQNQLHYKIENDHLTLYNLNGIELVFSENKGNSTLFFDELGL